MEDITVLRARGRARAPEYFEQTVLAELSVMKKKRDRARHLRLSLASAASAVFLVFIVVNFVLSPGGGNLDLSNLEKSFSSGSQQGLTLAPGATVPITELVNYSREIRPSQNKTPTVYILEQVSNRTDANKKY